MAQQFKNVRIEYAIHSDVNIINLYDTCGLLFRMVAGPISVDPKIRKQRTMMKFEDAVKSYYGKCN
jgi:hypothetical protein